MTKIEKLIEFEPKKKAIAAEVNSNFENLRLSNNGHQEQLEDLKQKITALKTNPSINILCDTETLVLNDTTYNFKVSGTTPIKNIIGLNSGFVFIEFTENRMLINTPTLKLQSNVDRICKTGDVGIYLFSDNCAKEINYFSAKEFSTNSYMTQTILDCPKNENGKADFLKKIELTKDITPVMTAFEDETCIISASSQYDAINHMPWKAVRHHTNDAFGWLTTNGIKTGWWKINFKELTPKVVCFAINARNTTDANTHCPCDFIMEGSNDDTNWMLLGDYTDNLNWLQNEKRYFALNYFDSFKYYRISITKQSGAGVFVGFGAIEFFEAQNDMMPKTVKVDLSMEKPLLLNNGIGTSTSGKTNQLAILAEPFELSNLLNNAFMYLGFEKKSDDKFYPILTPAQPVYSYKLQRHSNKKAIPLMNSATTSPDFNFGYTVTCSGFLSNATGTFYPQYAFNGNLASRWQASIAGNNQWIQINFPNYRKAARFSITASVEVPGGCIKRGYIKGFNGEEWVVLKEIEDETLWKANETRFFDADLIEDCMQFKLEIATIEAPVNLAQIAEFQIYEVAYCFVIPENKFYLYNIETKEFEEKEINFVGRIKTQNNFVSDVRSFGYESRYISDEINLAINSTYSLSHNIGMDFQNIKLSAWIKDNVNGFVLPWCVDSNIDYTLEMNNYGFFADDCTFKVRTSSKLMQYKDYLGANRTIAGNCSLFVQMERNF